MTKNMHKRNIYCPVSIEIFNNSVEVGKRAAEYIISVIKNMSDAVLILPTGDTPLPMYRELVLKFETDRTLNLSNVRIFNLDEYVGLAPDHPLSYTYYMNKVLYERLDHVDKSRAPLPQNRHIPSTKKGQSPQAAAKAYEAAIHHAINSTGRKKADLAVLGIGGAYPAKNVVGKFIGLKGGHIGFNEPGSKPGDRTRMVKLTKKTKLDTSFRFLNLRFCESIYGKEFPHLAPDNAITLGIENILESREVLLLASNEEKYPVIKEAFENPPNPDFPSTYLKYHDNVRWLLDKDAAAGLPHIRAPWKVSENVVKWDKELIRKVITEMMDSNARQHIEELDEKLLINAGVPSTVIRQFGGMVKIKQELSDCMKYFIHTEKSKLLPRKSRVMIFSPHPDDDVITMAYTIKKLVEYENDIWIIYMVNGENAVRNTDRAAIHRYNDLLESFKEHHSIRAIGLSEKEELWRQARIEVRKSESRAAAKLLGISDNRLTFLNLPYYYHRGLVDIDPIDYERDVLPVRDLLLQIRPVHIFYSAEADPHGAHGICAEIISRAIEKLLSFWNASFWGYRGAYEEWALCKCEDLIIVPFDEKGERLKTNAIKMHKSQLNPVFPSFDNRDFFERARERNHRTGRVLSQLGYLSRKAPEYAEVFRKIAYAEFIRTK